jgi:uncharacterized protein YutE (UPF0331/DUF86 family)
MRNLDREGIGKRLIGMVRRLNLLRPLKSMTLDEYIQDEGKQAIVERCLEIITQAAIDINKELIESVHRSRGSKFTGQESFILVGELNLISPELATALVKTAAFRNLLAHAYDNIVPDEAYSNMQLALVQYPEYIRQVKAYIDLREEDNE